MVTKSRWKAAHDRFPAHVEEAKNSEGAVHRGYHVLEFRVAAELIRIGPVHSADDYWAPSDWQLLLIVSEYMSALLEFLDWFWPELGWEHHKQAIVLSKRLLQPRSPYTYPDLQIDPRLRAAWQSFTYCFWHGTRHLPTTAPPGDPPALFSAAREWLTKLVGDRGFEVDGHISSSLMSWVQSMHPRLREAFPGVDWSRWPSVVWPDIDCAFRAVEKRGALKRRQQEEDYAVRWPLRVTQGRPKFNHLKMEARDGFVVGIPSIKNPPALGFLAISDIMCAFKQATQSWPPAVPLSPAYSAQQDVVQSFVQNVLRETRGPLAPGIPHEQYRYLGFVACCALGWQSALIHLAAPLHETSSWGPQPVVLPGSTSAPLPDPMQLAGHGGLGLGLELGLAGLGGLAGAPLGGVGGMGMGTVDLGLAAQLAMQPQLLPSVEAVEAALAGAHQRLPQQSSAPPVVMAGGAENVRMSVSGLAVDSAAAAETSGTGAGTGPFPRGSELAGGCQTDASQHQQQQQQHQQQHQNPSNPTRTRPSPFLTRQSAAGGAAQRMPGTTSLPQPLNPPPHAGCAGTAQGTAGTACGPPLGQQAAASGLLGPAHKALTGPQGGAGGCDRPAGHLDAALDGTAAMSIGGLSSMQDLMDGLPSQADISWSAILGAVAADDEAGGTGAAGGPGAGAGAAGPGPAGPSGGMGTLGTALTSFSQILLPPGWPSLRPLPPLTIPSTAPGGPGGMAAAASPQGGVPTSSSPPLADQLGSLRVPSATGLTPGLSGLQPFDSGLPCGTLHYPMCSLGGVLPPPRAAPDAPVLIQPSSRAGSPFQGTVTTGSLGAFVRPEPAAQEPRLARRSHGEVFTLSPVTSCGPAGETMPSSPAPADTAGSAAAGAGAAAGPTGRRSQEGIGHARARDAQAALPTGGRRTRQDVAAAAAAAAADAGLPPAPGSLVERSAKRPNAQVESFAVPKGVATAERVESLGAFLTDHQTDLAAVGAAAAVASVHERRATGCGDAAVSAGHGDAAGRVRSGMERQGAQSPDTSGAQAQREVLGQQLLALLRAWAEGVGGPGGGADGGGAAEGEAATAEVQRRAAELLEQGAPADAAEGPEGPAGTGGGGAAAESAGLRAGCSALHYACLRGDRPLAELLLRHGADPDQQDAAGVPARLANPDFAATVSELVAQERQRAATAPKTPVAFDGGAQIEPGRASGPGANQTPAAAIAAPPVPGATGAFASAFASANAVSAATAAAGVSGGGAMPVHDGPAGHLCQHLAELLAKADQLAGQLAQHDPDGASRAVLQAIQGTAYLSQLVSPEASKQQSSERTE